MSSASCVQQKFMVAFGSGDRGWNGFVDLPASIAYALRDPAAHRLAIERVAQCLIELGWQVDEAIPSPITGAEGNQEFLLHARRGERN